MIYFYNNLINKAMEYIHDSHEFLEIKQDMEKIEYAKMNIHTVEGIRFAKKLDKELRQKYPTINLMLDVANGLPKTIENRHAIVKEKMLPELDALQQDRCGIICDVLLKKSAVSSLKQCIDRVTE